MFKNESFDSIEVFVKVMNENSGSKNSTNKKNSKNSRSSTHKNTKTLVLTQIDIDNPPNEWLRLKETNGTLVDFQTYLWSIATQTKQFNLRFQNRSEQRPEYFQLLETYPILREYTGV